MYEPQCSNCFGLMGLGISHGHCTSQVYKVSIPVFLHSYMFVAVLNKHILFRRALAAPSFYKLSHVEDKFFSGFDFTNEGQERSMGCLQ